MCILHIPTDLLRNVLLLMPGSRQPPDKLVPVLFGEASPSDMDTLCIAYGYPMHSLWIPYA